MEVCDIDYGKEQTLRFAVQEFEEEYERKDEVT